MALDDEFVKGGGRSSIGTEGSIHKFNKVCCTGSK